MKNATFQRMHAETLVTIYHLEMLSREELRPYTGAASDFEMRRAGHPSPTFSRMLYAGVGGNWNWYERLAWSHEQWMGYLDRPELETWVGYRRGTPAGYCELERQAHGNVEVVYFGLLPEFIGQGLGGLLLTRAIERAWEESATRVWLHTCTLDHPYALRNYLARGFRVFREVQELVVLPTNGSSEPVLWSAQLPSSPSHLPKE